jgi:glyoxylase-like metal-dependent hydrolase (beta-lactamase superfamily II)
MRATLALTAIAALTVVAFSPVGFAQQRPAAAPAAPEVEVVHVRGPIYLIAGAGANVVVSAGPDGVLVTDTGAGPLSDRILDAIEQLQKDVATRAVPPLGWGALTRSTLEQERATPAPPKPIRFVVNTNADADHVGGNARIMGAGKTITGGNVAGDLGDVQDSAALYAHENVQSRMIKSAKAGEEPLLPTDTYFTPYYKLSHFFNGEGVQIIHMRNAHTDGDSIVWFRGSDVIVASDVFSTETYPHIDLEHGGSIQGVLDALNDILDLAITEFRTEGGTMIVPGHGAISDSADVAYYRDMVTKIRDRVEDGIKKGQTLQQIKASKPTRYYDPRYATPGGPTSPDGFVEAIYQSLTRKTS